MEAGVIRSLEVEDASPTSAALQTLMRWMERIAEKEVERITAKCQQYQEQGKAIPSWVRAGMDERFRRVEQMEQRVQMLLGHLLSERCVVPRVQTCVFRWGLAHSASGRTKAGG
jgi:hypothetical protein